MKKNPNRKPNKLLTGEELLRKAAYGTHKPKTDVEKLHEEAQKIIDK